MHCECELCIHNKDWACTLEEISVDQKGICHNCYDVSIPEDVLDLLKERHFKRVKKIQIKSDIEE